MSPFSSPQKESDGNPEDDVESTTVRNRHQNQTACNFTDSTNKPCWKPLVLFIPLRLGLSTMNMVYETALKVHVYVFVASFLSMIYIQR